MFILHYDDHGVDKAHELRSGVTLIGRLPTTEGQCFVQDTASRFGTFVNGARVQDEVELAPGSTLKLGEVTFTLEQRVPEQELLTEGHEVSEGPGTIYRPMTVEPPASSGGHLLRLLAEMGRTLLGTRSLTEILNRVVDVAFEA